MNPSLWIILDMQRRRESHIYRDHTDKFVLTDVGANSRPLSLRHHHQQRTKEDKAYSLRPLRMPWRYWLTRYTTRFDRKETCEFRTRPSSGDFTIFHIRYAQAQENLCKQRSPRQVCVVNCRWQSHDLNETMDNVYIASWATVIFSLFLNW